MAQKAAPPKQTNMKKIRVDASENRDKSVDMVLAFLLVPFLGWLSDLQLGDEKVTLNHLGKVIRCYFGISEPSTVASWVRSWSNHQASLALKATKTNHQFRCKENLSTWRIISVVVTG